jgi:hypothetical protein
MRDAFICEQIAKFSYDRKVNLPSWKGKAYDLPQRNDVTIAWNTIGFHVVSLFAKCNAWNAITNFCFVSKIWPALLLHVHNLKNHAPQRSQKEAVEKFVPWLFLSKIQIESSYFWITSWSISSLFLITHFSLSIYEIETELTVSLGISSKIAAIRKMRFRLLWISSFCSSVFTVLKRKKSIGAWSGR